MRPALALALLAAAAALPARAGTVYVPYAADEMVGSARYRTEIVATNRGNSPVRVETLFVSADRAKHHRRTTTVPAGGSSTLAGAVPAGAHGYLEINAPATMAFGARLLAYGPDGRARSGSTEPIIAASDLLPAWETANLLDLTDTASHITRLGIITVGGRGSCWLTAYRCSLDRVVLGSSSAMATATLTRDFAEPFRALRAGSVVGGWLAVFCDTPAYAHAAMLASDGNHTEFVAPTTSLNPPPIQYYIEDVVPLPPPPGTAFEEGNSTGEPMATGNERTCDDCGTSNPGNEEVDKIPPTCNIRQGASPPPPPVESVSNFTNKQIDELSRVHEAARCAPGRSPTAAGEPSASPVGRQTVYVPYAADELVGSARYRTEIAVTNYESAPVRVRTVFVAADGTTHAGEATTIPANGSSFLPSPVPDGAHGQAEVIGPPGIAVSARLIAFGKDSSVLSSDMESVALANDLIPAGQTFYLANPKDWQRSTVLVTRLGIVTADATGSCSFVAYSDTDREDVPPQALGTGSFGKAGLTNSDPRLLLRGKWLAVTCDEPAYAYAVVLETSGGHTRFVAPSPSRPKTGWETLLRWILHQGPDAF